MEFGIFSNGFRPHTSAGKTYDEDIYEIVLADELGFRDAYISEHHGEPPYINRVDTIPAPDMLMCKAAALTKRIRMGAAVKLIHLHHPLDVAIQAAITYHLLGGRYIFGFGSGFPSPLFSEERALVTAFLESAAHVIRKVTKYANAARAHGRPASRRHVAASRVVYIAASRKQAIEDMRAAVAYEVSVQAQRGFLNMLKRVYGLDVPNDGHAIDALVESGFYLVGDADSIAARIKDYYDETGGFGTFLIVTGKDWATREHRARSMRLFMEQVAPQLRHLDPDAEALSLAKAASGGRG